jgi:periplasmic copper chaperone A
MRAATIWAVLVGCTAVFLGGVTAAQRKDPSTSNAWVGLPTAGATSTNAYVSVDNPTQYDFYLQKASADVAGSVELREPGKTAASAFVTVPAYGSLDMEPKGTYLLLKDLKKPLAEGDKVQLTLVTDGGLTLKSEATVRKTP